MSRLNIGFQIQLSKFFTPNLSINAADVNFSRAVIIMFRHDHGGMPRYQRLAVGQDDVATCFLCCVSTVRCIV